MIWVMQGILICNASSIQSSLEEQSQKDTLNKGVGQMSIQRRDSEDYIVPIGKAANFPLRVKVSLEY